MPLCKEKKAAESEVLATCLQHISAAKTRRRHVGKASRRSERRPPSAKTIIFPTAGSTFPWNRSTEWGGKSTLGLTEKNKKKKQVTDVVVLVLVPLQRYRFGQRRQQEELFTWQLIQSLRCSISPPCHHQVHNFALELKLPRQMGGTPTAFAGF